MSCLAPAGMLEFLDRQGDGGHGPGPDDVASLEVRVLNGFEVRVSQCPVALPKSAQRLVAFLALNRRPVSRAYAGGTLWSEYTDERSMANLRAALWRLRQANVPVVEVTSGLLKLAPGVKVDVWELARLAHRLLDPGGSCPEELLASGIVALTSEVLPEWYDDEWLVAEREHLRQLRLHALEALAERLISMERHGQAVEAALAAVRLEPLQESAHAVLIRAHLLGGNRCQALRQYEQCRVLLRQELCLEPSRHLESLVEGLGQR